MDELWQLYNEQGDPIFGRGATKDEAYGGLLHGASHVWIWREGNEGIEVLLQKRAANKRTWPNLLDISAAGHIDLGENPIEAAVRETHEEIGLTINPDSLILVGAFRQYLKPGGSNDIVNEFCWVYTLKLQAEFDFKLQVEEVESIVWRKLSDMKQELADNTLKQNYVPHYETYYQILFDFLESGRA